MSDFKKDLAYLDSIIDGDKDISNDTFCKMYPLTNDSIYTIYNCLPSYLEGKDLFTVLSSGDFLFTSLTRGVEDIDAFDVNPLTYRYFYLRKWLLENGILDAAEIGLEDIEKIISGKMNVSSKDEQESAQLWYYYLNKLKETGGIDFYDTKLFSAFKRTVLPYKGDIDLVTSELSNRGISFYNENICSNDFRGPDKKYGLVYLSNILDYNRSKERLKIVSSNLDKLLTDDGVVMCTTLFNHIGLEMLEIPFFEEKYNFSYIPRNGRTRTYVYEKK